MGIPQICNIVRFSSTTFSHIPMHKYLIPYMYEEYIS